MAKRKTVAELQAEVELLKREKAARGWVEVVNNVVKWGGLVLIARYGYLTIDSLAGGRTMADIGIQLFTDIRISSALAWVLAGSGIYYGHRQRKLRGDVVERLQRRIRELEERLDPNRSSSRLTPRGETNPEDR